MIWSPGLLSDLPALYIMSRSGIYLPERLDIDEM